MPDISYSFYQVYCRLYDIPVDSVPLTQEMSVDVTGYARADGCSVAGVVIANPNAPTGMGLSLHQVEQFLREHPTRVVLVDEA
jgi:histidinol-phosphate aminotransferase